MNDPLNLNNSLAVRTNKFVQEMIIAYRKINDESKHKSREFFYQIQKLLHNLPFFIGGTLSCLDDGDKTQVMRRRSRSSCNAACPKMVDVHLPKCTDRLASLP